MSEGHLYPAAGDARPRPEPGAAQCRRDGPRTAEARLEEAVGLARAIDLEVVHGEVVRLSRLRPATLAGLGRGRAAQGG